MDPLLVENYKKRLTRLGRVNEDIYAYQFDPELEWLLKPGAKIVVKNYFFSAILVDRMPEWTIVSNLEGFRTQQEERKDDVKFPNTIYILGDSSSFGWGVNFAETYGVTVQDQLNGGGNKKFALSNYSIPGFSSFQGRLLAEQMEEFNPGDLVLVSFGWNDSYAAIDSDRERFEKRHSFLGKFDLELNGLKSYRWVKSFLARKNSGETGAEKTGKKRVNLKDYEENLRYVFQLIRQKKGRPIFVNVCNGGEYFKAAEKVSRSLDIPFFNFPKQMLPYMDKVAAGEIKTEKYLAYLDSYGSLMKEDGWLTVLFPDRCHPNAIGHYLMGEIISAGIQKL